MQGALLSREKIKNWKRRISRRGAKGAKLSFVSISSSVFLFLIYENKKRMLWKMSGLKTTRIPLRSRTEGTMRLSAFA
ncbi:MAG: hypothetical protein LBI04_05890 [Treponema sp.]|jgi:hypothetical protein|nr:hypothetical protein [Treponema sp.]